MKATASVLMGVSRPVLTALLLSGMETGPLLHVLMGASQGHALLETLLPGRGGVEVGEDGVQDLTMCVVMDLLLCLMVTGLLLHVLMGAGLSAHKMTVLLGVQERKLSQLESDLGKRGN